MGKKLQRSCVGCRAKKDKQELIRIVQNKNGSIIIDKTGNLPGRGAYLCKEEACLEKTIKMKKLNKEFKTEIPDIIYEELRGAIFEQR